MIEDEERPSQFALATAELLREFPSCENDIVKSAQWSAHTNTNRVRKGVRGHIDAIAAQLQNQVFTIAANEGDEVLGMRVERSFSIDVAAPFLVQGVGSVCTGTNVGNSTLDIAIRMPDNLFLNRDHINFRYLIKRALFVDALEKVFSRNKSLSISRESFGVSSLKPTLIFNMKFKSNNELMRVRILPCVNATVLLARRLAPQRNALRVPDATVATPHYNAIVCEDIELLNAATRITHCLVHSSQLQHAIILLKTWAFRRELLGVHALTSHSLSLIVTSIVNVADMTAVQLFRTALQAIVDNEDETIFPCISASALNTLKMFAVSSLRLPMTNLQHFTDLFLTPVSFKSSVDTIVHIYDQQDIECSRARFSMDQLSVLPKSELLANTYVSILSQALGDRALLVRHHIKSANHICIGIILNDNTCSRTIDLCDSDENSMAFRRFWGKRSTLRRFQDGRICEAVVWVNDDDDEDMSDTRLRVKVVRLIIQYALQRHCGVEVVRIVDGQCLESMLPPLTTKQSLNVAAAFQRLRETIRDLDFPLNMRALMCGDSALRGGTIPLGALRVVLQVDSARWPEDLGAILRIKTAYYIRIASMLMKQGVAARAFERHLLVWMNTCDDSKHFVFKLHMYHSRELVIRKSERDFPTVRKTLDSTVNEIELATLECDVVHRSLISAELKSITQRFATFSTAARLVSRWLHAHLLGSALCQEAIELILASVYTSLHTHINAPSSLLAAFTRFLALLCEFPWQRESLIIDFHNDMSEEDRSEVEQSFSAIRQKGCQMVIASSRDLKTSFWTSSTPNSSQLTRLQKISSSTLKLFHRLIDLPRNIDVTHSDWKTSFRTPIKNFDFFITLIPSRLPQRSSILFPYVRSKKNSTKHVSLAKNSAAFKASIPSRKYLLQQTANTRPDFDVVSLLIRDLRSAFLNVLEFHYDAAGTDIVFASIVPQTTHNVSLAYRSTHSEKRRKLQLDKLAIASDIKRFGAGIVHQVFIGYDTFKLATQ